MTLTRRKSCTTAVGGCTSALCVDANEHRGKVSFLQGRAGQETNARILQGINRQNQRTEIKDRESALIKVRSYKEAILPLLSDAKVYLYGSCSRNEAHKDSDIDVAVVIPKLQGDWLATTSSLWLATLGVDTSIEPVVIDESHPSPLYEDVMRSGIAV